MTAEQAAAFSDPTRDDIVRLLTERPASVSQLAAALGKPKGTVGHHVKVLEDLGLVAVVRTRKVRAVTEKYYGRVASTFLFPHLEEGDPGARSFLIEAFDEMRPPGQGDTALVTVRHARIPAHRAAEWEERLFSLTEEFAASGGGGATTYGLLVAFYPTDRPGLSDDDGEESE